MSSRAQPVLFRAVHVLALVLLALSVGVAQEQPKTSPDGAAINGTATDQTQAVLSEAKAVLTSATGEKLEAPVDEKGVYSFTGIKPGTYTLTVTAPNFAPKTFDNISLTPGLELTLDAVLEPASAKREEVNVESGSLERVETESSTVRVAPSASQRVCV